MGNVRKFCQARFGLDIFFVFRYPFHPYCIHDSQILQTNLALLRALLDWKIFSHVTILKL